MWGFRIFHPFAPSQEVIEEDADGRVVSARDEGGGTRVAGAERASVVGRDVVEESTRSSKSKRNGGGAGRGQWGGGGGLLQSGGADDMEQEDVAQDVESSGGSPTIDAPEIIGRGVGVSADGDVTAGALDEEDPDEAVASLS